MDLALKVAESGTPQLDTGIADKLRAAATSMGAHVVPCGDVEANGMLWRLMATYARLNTSELLALIMWLEVAYSATMSARAAAHLPMQLGAGIIILIWVPLQVALWCVTVNPIIAMRAPLRIPLLILLTSAERVNRKSWGTLLTSAERVNRKSWGTRRSASGCALLPSQQHWYAPPRPRRI